MKHVCLLIMSIASLALAQTGFDYEGELGVAMQNSDWISYSSSSFGSASSYSTLQVASMVIGSIIMLTGLVVGISAAVVSLRRRRKDQGSASVPLFASIESDAATATPESEKVHPIVIFASGALFITGLALLLTAVLVSQPQSGGGEFGEAQSRSSSGLLSESQAYDLYQYIKKLEATPHPTVGNAGSCVGGRPPQSIQDTTITLINAYRRFNSLKPVSEVKAWQPEAQAAALTNAANPGLSHGPPVGWRCRTASAVAGSGSSNLVTTNQIRGVGIYIDDFGASNAPVGHRRWVFYPGQSGFGLGSVQSSSGTASALKIWGSGSPAPHAWDENNQVVAWPSPGAFPLELMPTSNRWSFSKGKSSAFSSGTPITMTVDGVPIGVSKEPVSNGYGANTIVWKPSSQPWKSKAKSVIKVTVGSYSYSVVAIKASGTSRPSGPSVSVPNAPGLPVGPAAGSGGGGSSAYQGVKADPAIKQGPNTPSEGSLITPIKAVRVIDTRVSGGGRKVGPGYILKVPCTGKGGIPSDATGVIFTLTVTQTEGPGFLTAYAHGLKRPTTSNLNYGSGDTTAILATSNLNAGAISVFTLSSTHIIVDVVAYLSPKGGYKFNGINPFRAVDTRRGFGGAMRGGESRAFTLVNPGKGMPANAVGASINIAVTQTGGNGFLTVYPGPCKATPPQTSAINFRAGQTIANMNLALLGSGKVCVFAHAPTQVILDVGGFIGGAAKDAYWPITPQRLVDTRSGNAIYSNIKGKIGQSKVLRVPITTTAGVPSAAKSVALHVTVIGDGPGFATVYPCGGALPGVSNVNYVPGMPQPNLVFVKIGSGQEVCVFTHTTAHVIVDLQGFFAPQVNRGVAGPRATTKTPAMGEAAKTKKAKKVKKNCLSKHAVAKKVKASKAFYEKDVKMCMKLESSSKVCKRNAKAHMNKWIKHYKSKQCKGSKKAKKTKKAKKKAKKAGLGFVALKTPKRLVQRMKLQTKKKVVVKVAGHKGVPTDASAVVLNIVSINANQGGHLKVSPKGTHTQSSSLNFNAHETVANQGIYTLKHGAIEIVSSYHTHILVDVVGYFTSSASGHYFPSAAKRIEDSRHQRGMIGKNFERTYKIDSAKHSNAVALNVAVTGGQHSGHLQAYAGKCKKGGAPATSIINWAGGSTIANSVIVGVQHGEFCIKSSAAKHVIVDYSGSFQAKRSGARYFPFQQPARWFDSRGGPKSNSFQVKSEWDVAGLALQVVTISDKHAGFVSVAPCGTNTDASFINFGKGVRSNFAIVKGKKACFKSSAKVHIVVDVVGVFKYV